MLNLSVIFLERNVFFTAYSVLVYCFTSAVHSVNRTSALTIPTKMDESTLRVHTAELSVHHLARETSLNLITMVSPV